MQISKKIALTVIILSAFPLVSLAEVYGGLEGPGASLSITSIGLGIANAIWVVFTIIAVIAFVTAGVLFLTAFGDPTKLTKARSAFIWGIAGVFVAILAYGIVSLIRTLIGA